MKILAQHGDIQLIEYDNGNYAVEYNEPSTGKTLLYTRDYLLALEYFHGTVAQKKDRNGGNRHGLRY